MSFDSASVVMCDADYYWFRERASGLQRAQLHAESAPPVGSTVESGFPAE